MSLELLPRIPFGPADGDPEQSAPWNPPVSAFNIGWLKGTFVPAQRDRLARVTDLITKANAEIDKLRDKGTVPEVGQRQANGVVLRSANDAQLEQTLRTHAQQQLVMDIIALRQPLDLIVVPILKDMNRASLVSDTPRARIFDKISCLSRAAMLDMKPVALAAYKAPVMDVIHNVSPVELNRMIQAALDDGGGDSLPLLDCLRMENFSRPKDHRGGDNARLLALANVPEFTESQPLLDEVQSCYQQARLLWSAFGQHSSRVNLMKMSLGFDKLDTAAKTSYVNFGVTDMAKRTINVKATRGGVPARVTVRAVAPRKSGSISAGEVGSPSGKVKPTKVTGPASVKGCAG